MTISRLPRWLAAILPLLVLATLFAAPRTVEAAPRTFTVTRADDPTPGPCAAADCSLREAIVAANLLPGSTVQLAAVTYTLSIRGADAAASNDKVGDLDIHVGMTIKGTSTAATVIRAGATPGSGIHRIFEVSARQPVLITNLTMANGADVENNSGGCIRNVGNLTLDAVIIKGCTSQRVGAGVSSYGILLVKNSIVTGNVVSSPTGGRVSGGGISGGPGTQFPPGVVTITGTTISGNVASSAGDKDLNALGGGFANTATMTITDSVVDGNSALNAGGGINVGDMTIARTKFINNTSRYDVGALDNDVRMTIDDSLFANNTAGFRCQGTQCNRGYAGGVLNTAGGTMFFNNSTISGNSCVMSGGGILNARGLLVVRSATIVDNTCGVGAGLSASDTTKVMNTIIGGNTATDPQGHSGDCSGRVDSEGFILVQDKRGCLVAGDLTGTIIGQDPLVAPLRDNGGVTSTMALMPNSPAINAGDPQGCKDGAGVLIDLDQRGKARVARGRCDMGAFELQP